MQPSPDRGGGARRKPPAKGRLTFLVDENLGTVTAPQALRAAGFEVITVRDRFGAGTADVVWLAEAGRRGWLVLTADGRLSRNKLEIRALAEAKVMVFVLPMKNLAGPILAAICTSRASSMMRFAQSHRAPFVASVTKSGVRMLRDSQRLTRDASRLAR